MFVDHAIVTCIAGHGGKGCNSFARLRHLNHPRPHGGDGGRGGSVVFESSQQIRTLLDIQMRHQFKAQSGAHGQSNHKNGAEGHDMILKVPIGTQIIDENNGLMLSDLIREGQSVVAAHGGSGGKGNHRHAEATEGCPGETKLIRLELKLLADVGLIGCPNAGKSTLISHLSNAKSKIAAFPFTTKKPVLGVMRPDVDTSVVLADIPGLIKGAHEGRGLGIQFLKHIERTRVLLQVIDMSGLDGRDPNDDFDVVQKELREYSKDLAGKKLIVALNKMDVPESSDNLIRFKKMGSNPVVSISAATGQGLEELKKVILKTVNEAD